MLKGFLAILSVVVTIALPVPVDACDCAVKPVCDAFWTADVVFVGRVERLTGADSRNVEAHLLVERWLRGEKIRSRIDIDMRGAGIACDAYSFYGGQRYLVYATKGTDGGWRTPLCGGTRPLESAAEDLEYARNALRRPEPGTVSGFAFVDTMPDPDAQGGPPLAGAQLTLTSSSHRYTTTTDQKGDYRFERVVAGEYVLRVDPLPDTDATPPKRLVVVGAKACIRHVFWTSRR